MTSEPGARVRVLHVLAELQASGAEMMLKSSLPAMDAGGVDTAIVSTGRERGKLFPVFEGLGVPVHHLPFRQRAAFLVQLGRLARQYDVVHLHTERASFWLAGTVRLFGVPVVRTVHNTFLFTGRLRRVRAVQRRLLRRAGVQFIAIGRDVADNELSRFGLATELVPNWPEGRYFRPAQEEVSREGSLILSVGNCGALKNHEALIEAVALLHGKGVACRYLHLGGRAGETLDEAALAQALGCSDSVDFAGVADPLDALKRAAVFVMPSRREGLSVAALEALAAGTPTVLTAVQGLRELREVPGVWWSAPNAADLAETLESVLSLSGAQREARARAGAAFVAVAFDPARSQARLIDIYRSALRQAA